MDIDALIAAADSAAEKLKPSSKYDPEQSRLRYLAEQSKLVPAGLAGSPLDFLYNLRDFSKAAMGTPYLLAGKVPPEGLQVGQPSNLYEGQGVLNAIAGDRLGGGGTFAELFGHQNLRAPDYPTKLSSDVLNALAASAIMKKPAQMSLPQVVTTGIGSGVGANVAQEAFPESPAAGPIGALIGGPVANVYPIVSPTANALRLGRTLLSPEQRQTFIDQNKPAVSDMVRKNLENSLAAEIRANPSAFPNIEQAMTAAQSAPGVKLDIGQASLIPSIIQKVKGAAVDSPESLNAKAIIDSLNREAVAKGAVGSAAGTADIGALAQGKVGSIEAQIAAADKAAEAMAQSRQALAGSIPRSDLEVLGGRARDVRATEKATADIRTKELLGVAEQAAGTKPFDVSGIVNAVDTAAQQPIFKYEPARQPKIMSRIEALKQGAPDAVQLYGPNDKPLTAPSKNIAPVQFGELRAMREAVNEDIRNASVAGDSTARQQRRELLNIKDTIDKTILESGGPQVQKAYGDFVNYYRDEYAPRFLRGVNIKQTLTDSSGVKRIADETLFNNYFRASSPQAARQYLSLYGASGEGKTLMHNAVLDRYAKEVVGNKSEISPQAHAAFMAKYQAPLRVLQEGGINVSDSLANTGSAARTMFDRIGAIANERDILENDAFTKSVTDKFGVKTPDSIMQSAVSDPRRANLVLSGLGKEGAQGMVNWIGNDLATTVNAAPPGSVGSALMSKLQDKNYMQAYRMAMERAHGKDIADQQMRNLNNLGLIARRLEVTELDPYAGIKNPGQVGQLSDKTGFTVRSVWSLVRGIMTGRTSESDMAVVLGGQFGTKQISNMRNEVMREIATNPEMLNRVLTIAKSNTPQATGVKEAALGILSRIPSLGKSALGSLQKAAPAAIVQEQQGPPS